MNPERSGGKPGLLVLASTYPRWTADPEPRFVHELCRRLVGRFDVIAVVPDASDADLTGALDSVEVVRYRYAPRRLQTLVNNGGIVTNLRRAPWKWLLVPGFVVCQWWVARRILRRRRIAVIHAHWLIPQGLVAGALSRASRLPYVVTSHGGDLFGLRGRLLTMLKRKVVSSAKAMTVVSTAMKAEVLRAGLDPRELRVIPMGVDLKGRFVQDDRIVRSNAELLFVGRLVPKKGLIVLIEALPAVIARCPDVSLTIVGFGPEEARLRQSVDVHGLTGRVHFLGAMPQDQLPPLYQRAAVFVSPFMVDSGGDQEGLPVALMEAIACGCPAVVGDVAGVRDLLGDSDTRAVVPRGDVQALADALVHMLTHPLEARMRANALAQEVRDRIDWDNIASAYADLLEQAAKATSA
jgi:glycosyltransferase involved in cell wall biosynthesis